MGYDAGDDHGQSKEGPQKHDDEGADGGEEKAVSGSIGSNGKQEIHSLFLQSLLGHGQHMGNIEQASVRQ